MIAMIGLLLLLVATAALTGVVAGRRPRRVAWPIFFVLVSVPFALLIAAGSFLLMWAKWKSQDDWIQSQIDRALTVETRDGGDRTYYELEFGGGLGSRIVRRPFDWPIDECLRLGIVSGIAAAGVSTLARRIAAEPLLRRARKGQCLYCGYNLHGNVTGICPECGRPIGSVSGQGDLLSPDA